jgi:predicted enzyme related to lactoylglutathione lyase
VHFEIIGEDAPKLQRFYADLFDWKIDADNEWQYGMVETGGNGGINGGISGDMGGGKRVTVYAQVDDPQKYLDKVESLGGSVLMPVTDMGEVVIAMFSDPAGNVTGLVKG